MLQEVRCEKTRQYIQHFGEQKPLPWTDIVRMRPNAYNASALDMIASLVQMEATDRMDVYKALKHPFLAPFVSAVPVERGCPFKVVFVHIIS